MGFSSFPHLLLLSVLVVHLGLTVETALPPNSQAVSRVNGRRQVQSDPYVPVGNQSKSEGRLKVGSDNIILNPIFENGLSNWTGKGCNIFLYESMGDGNVLPPYGKFFASATNRAASWNGIEQEITGRMQTNIAYEVTAVVRIYGGNLASADVQITLWVQSPDMREQYIKIAITQATENDWVQLQGKLLLNGAPSRVIIFLEGPPPGTDILISSLVVKHAEKTPRPPRPAMKDAPFGVNIIENSDLEDETNWWFPLGNCALSIGIGSPLQLPPMAIESLGPHEPLSGCYILATNRTDSWMGAAQMITDRLKLYLTYQVSAWVRIGPGSTSPQIVNLALGVDGKWINGGQVEINDDVWHEVGGSFRIEKQPSKVMVYVQGPAPGVDLMVSGLQIFPVDRKARFRFLKRQTDKIRKRNVILRFSGSEASNVTGNFVEVKQAENSFPFGSCITRASIDNEHLVDFLVKNFNWVVFGNELKWPWIERQQGILNYKDADDLLNFCENYNLEIRGHCIFWEMEYAVQSWVQSLNGSDLLTAVQKHLTDLLMRYKGKFKHYDVDNEMLHGSFYKDRLGKDIQTNMFKMANQLDPSASLFVNDYHVEDGSDIRSSPEKYIQQILDLKSQGAPVGGIGIQGHIESPVGPIVRSALDKLGTLGLPIWFTELDVSSTNEYVRADDLEVMLREAFAHPSVEGIILWGFWELYMSRQNAYLVNAEGKINEAGRRYLALKKEWLSYANGHIDALGEFRFRGFYGTYNVEISSPTGKLNKTFVVEKGQFPLLFTIDL
ncbi:hypothetical protein SLE2022_114300 [Rubroshorea leprosula]